MDVSIVYHAVDGTPHRCGGQPSLRQPRWRQLECRGLHHVASDSRRRDRVRERLRRSCDGEVALPNSPSEPLRQSRKVTASQSPCDRYLAPSSTVFHQSSQQHPRHANTCINMPPLHHLSRRLVASSASPLAVRAPIGWLADSQPAAARHIQTAARSRPNVRTNVESWGAARQQTASGWRVQSHASPVTTSRVAGCVRIQSTHARPHGAASSPKRSNTAPLLGGVFGATVFAYLGAKLQLQKEDEEEENPIKSDGKLELANAEGILYLPTPLNLIVHSHARRRN